MPASRRWWLALLALAPAPRAECQDAIDRFVAAEMARQHIPGLAVAVVSRGRVVKARGYGLANVELKVPASDSTVFQSGSVGKQFTAAAVLLLVEDGKLTLDAPITQFLPEGQGMWTGITIRHLLTHTAGVREYTDAGDSVIDLRHDYSEDQLVQAAARLPLDFAPGSHWRYSNTGYLLLGVIIHRASGLFYGDLLAQRVFRPLGMRTARVISEADIVPNRAAGYRLVEGELKNQEWVAPSLNTTADGALYLTVHDLAAWDRALTDGRILQPASRVAMWTPAQLSDGGSVDYGFGWRVSPYRGRRAIGHTGSWQGFKAMIQRFPDDSLSVILLANLAETRQPPIVYGIAGLLRPTLVPPHALPPRADSAFAAQLGGFLFGLAAGRGAPALVMVPGFAASVFDEDRREWGALLAQRPVLTFRGCDDVSALALERHGALVTRSCYLTIAGKGGPLLATFWLTEDDRVAEVSTYGY